MIVEVLMYSRKLKVSSFWFGHLIRLSTQRETKMFEDILYNDDVKIFPIQFVAGK